MVKITEKAYEVRKTFNNNIVLVDDNEKEIILFAKGIGFNYKKGSIIPKNTNIEKIFTIQNEKNIANFKKVIGNNNKKFIALCEELILEVSKEFNEEFNEIIHIDLINYISLAIERIKKGEILRNPFLVETEVLYPKEFKAATNMVKKIESSTGISIADDEIGFIAMYIHSAIVKGKTSSKIKYNYIASTAVEFIEDAFNIEVDRTSLSYARFISHLKFAIERLLKNTKVKNELLSVIKLKYPESFVVAKEIGKVIDEDLSLIVTDDEVGYLTLHIERIRKGE